VTVITARLWRSRCRLSEVLVQKTFGVSFRILNQPIPSHLAECGPAGTFDAWRVQTVTPHSAAPAVASAWERTNGVYL